MGSEMCIRDSLPSYGNKKFQVQASNSLDIADISSVVRHIRISCTDVHVSNKTSNKRGQARAKRCHLQRQLVPPNYCRKLSQVRKRNSSWHELEIRRKSGHYLAESGVPGKVGAERQTADRGKENRNRWKQLCFPNRVC